MSDLVPKGIGLPAGAALGGGAWAAAALAAGALAAGPIGWIFLVSGAVGSAATGAMVGGVAEAAVRGSIDALKR